MLHLFVMLRSIYVAMVDDLHLSGGSSKWEEEICEAEIIDDEAARNGGILISGYQMK